MSDSSAADTLQSGRNWARRGSWRNALICFEHALNLMVRDDATAREILNTELLLSRAHYELKQFSAAEVHVRNAIGMELELCGPDSCDGNEFRTFLVLVLLGQQRTMDAEREAKRAHRTAMRLRPLNREHVDRCYATLRVARSALRGEVVL